MLSLVVPAVLLILATKILETILGPSFYLRLLMLPLFWLVAGHTQSHLLIRRLPRRRSWAIVTCVGGSFGLIGGGSAQLWLNGTITSAFGSGVAPFGSIAYWLGLLSIGVAGAVGAGILAFMQSMCLDGPRLERILWFLESASCGFLAAGTSRILGDVLSWLISGDTPGSYEAYRSQMLSYFWRSSIMNILGLSVFGLLTGSLLRSLILRRVRLGKDLLVGQFD